MKRVAILMYHQVEVARPAGRFVCHAATFARQMAWLRASGVALVSVADVARAARGEADIAAGAVAVSFDDGYAGVIEAALPALERHAIPATLFAVAGRLGGRDDWQGGGAALLDASGLRALQARGVEIGSHALSHVRLSGLGDAALEAELQHSRARLAEVLGRPVELLAYPYGDCDARVIAQARAVGYLGACSTRSGFNVDGVDPFALRRIDIDGRDGLHTFRRKVMFGTNRWTMRDEARYFGSRLWLRLSGRRQGGKR
ncbi:polysaccharide deacetylase family protein [Marichromatium bheemlicum]|uniref:Polysaccharide deacetylase family protein n=1 Tax=Marichromatium bheemlicum TaxID=365339 RepID=A0ABX1I8V7_9GAMM|nr:polysaccharide deacetylase family protein [Marichromatium bheemlicum]NKN33379.1 polysaccharide deacetylase family protein [Marichromatium bheemlicum]